MVGWLQFADCLLSCCLLWFMTWLIASNRRLGFLVILLWGKRRECYVKSSRVVAAETSQCFDGHEMVSKVERVLFPTSWLFTCVCFILFGVFGAAVSEGKATSWKPDAGSGQLRRAEREASQVDTRLQQPGTEVCMSSAKQRDGEQTGEQVCASSGLEPATLLWCGPSGWF